MTLPRYPAYKDSGVEWLGEIPTHWSLKRLRHLTKCLDGQRIPLNAQQRSEMQGDVPYWGANSVMDYVNDKLFDEELVLLGEDGAPFFDRFRPVAFYSLGPVWPNNHIHVLRPVFPNTARFITHALNASDYADFIDGSTRDKLTQGQMNRIPVALPSINELSQITLFLDHETSKIDALIAEQKNLIALLKEKRQAVISHAVTKGLNPDVPMKDTGVEWLGEVPEYWHFGSLSRFAVRVVVGIAEAATHAYSDTGVPILRSTNVKGGKILGEILRISEEFAQSLGSKKIRSGDLVTVRTGNAGVTAVVPEELDGCQCFTMLITSMREGFNSDYISYFMNSENAQRYFALEGWGTAQVNISVPILKSVSVAAPPLKEQNEIVEFLDHETKVIAELVSATEQSMQLLNERRSALISAAVTGKIDVRGLMHQKAA